MEEGVLGLPPGLVGQREELTPMLSQYAAICADYEDALVLFQVGDFYEGFCEAAEVLARELEITLTKREDSTGTYPMAGIPIDNAAAYTEGLLQSGYRVAIADQIQDPADSTGPVDRAVTRVLTPGTVVDDELLDPGSSNYVACLAGATAESRADADGDSEDGDDARSDGDDDGSAGREDETSAQDASERTSDSDRYAVAFADVSTGEFLVTSAGRATVGDELDRFAPAEVLFAPEISTEVFDLPGMVTAPGPELFEYETAADRVRAAGNALDSLDGIPETRACGALLAYVEYTQGDVSSGSEDEDDDIEGTTAEKGSQNRSGTITRYEPTEHLHLDGTALESLEVFAGQDGSDDHTLFAVLDDSSSALGRRRLAGWLRRPLLDAGEIEARHDAVEELLEKSLLREELRDLLSEVYDLARLSTRVSRERANARDLRSLGDTLAVVPQVREALSGADSAQLLELRDSLGELGDIRGLIERAIQSDPPIEVTEGGVIEAGFDEGLDSLRETEQSGREWVADLEASERQKTGIESLSVGYNQVHGYYIEVTNANLDRVPEEYTRRQTLKNAERYYTPELKRREEEILSAGERADEREYELFGEVRSEVGAEADRIDRVADALADLDALCTLAAIASEREFVRPEVGCEEFELRASRHPVVEEAQESFVPNDVSLDAGEVAVITGPNMAGKSTYMRQVALCTLLAQIGSFVPAREARLPVVDRIFTRVGASDDIAGGQSTFMREMTELATILRGASSRSLVILDEVGRGTSTADGRAIARAAIEELHETVGARTLFATHYHELTELATEYERVNNYHFAADREGGKVTFLHSVAPGATGASYGIDVASLAGVPETVVERSRELVAEGNSTDTDAASERERSVPATNGHGPTLESAAGRRVSEKEVGPG
ncbi:DNA mismatch repair protein MutS, partial [Halobacteriales archaeon QS_3_64_16]